MNSRTLTVKLMEGKMDKVRVTLFFQLGDWAVTQGICKIHSGQCFRLTHVPSTNCIPVCLHELSMAQKFARRINKEIPKFKQPTPRIVRQFSAIIIEMLKEHGAPLKLQPGYKRLSPQT